MALRLTITSYHKITPGQCPEKTLEYGSMAIGRNPDNDWVLPDPARLVSSKHCLVQNRDGRYYITDSSTNGVELVKAGIRMQRGNSELLNHGEVIRIGEYEIQVALESSVAEGSAPFSTAPSGNSFEALMASHQDAPPVPLSPPANPFDASASAHLQSVAPHETLPDLFDFLGPSTSAPAPVADHVPAQQHDFRPPEVRTPPVEQKPTDVPGLIPDDWDLLDNITPAAIPPAAPPPADLSPQPAQIESAPLPPPPAAAPTPAPVASPSQAARNDDLLLQAFLRGAGLERLRLDTQQAAEQMESIGRSYRLMVDGLIDVLRARSSLKGEFRLQQTMVQPVENNPLKFAPNAEEALLLLLRGGNSAFMSADQAVQDGFDDLRAHQLAVMAGVQAAIRHLLARFEPQALEARMGKGGGLASLLPNARQAQCWQQFVELYTTLSREAEDDFQDLFGREFGRAYEQHIARQRRP
ncbi:type VI secretion system-associated FHA domain protein TagH [Pseudomonas sediminis]|uniref:Type VI secretion system-associated FHA domain protein TagH n=1 Tax=Pseudomonas sediminis TaxID=1691904 RepID=A0ABX6SIF2_9PSED|nr:type VI secretion system-associated FHA domain protein TagH [Pseudomonas sediminis]QNH01418.1 type VI secretion system-associated FHA domain protein TagH [Pseudomonas sediminis]